jgi:hypothetical protein
MVQSIQNLNAPLLQILPYMATLPSLKKFFETLAGKRDNHRRLASINARRNWTGQKACALMQKCDGNSRIRIA